jgi:hypothetical protein
MAVSKSWYRKPAKEVETSRKPKRKVKRLVLKILLIVCRGKFPGKV